MESANTRVFVPPSTIGPPYGPNPSTVLGRQSSAHTGLTRWQLWRAETPSGPGPCGAPHVCPLPCTCRHCRCRWRAQRACVFASSGDGGPLPCFTDGYVASVVRW